MKEITIIIEASPVGYYAQGKHPNWSRMARYREYKQEVQRQAVAQGVELPLYASEMAPVTIHVTSYFFNRVHSDPGNVHKGIVDALFYGAGGSGDKHTGGSYDPPKYDKENPRAEVTIAFNSAESVVEE